MMMLLLPISSLFLLLLSFFVKLFMSPFPLIARRERERGERVEWSRTQPRPTTWLAGAGGRMASTHAKKRGPRDPVMVGKRREETTGGLSVVGVCTRDCAGTCLCSVVVHYDLSVADTRAQRAMTVKKSPMLLYAVNNWKSQKKGVL